MTSVDSSLSLALSSLLQMSVMKVPNDTLGLPVFHIDLSPRPSQGVGKEGRRKRRREGKGEKGRGVEGGRGGKDGRGGITEDGEGGGRGGEEGNDGGKGKRGKENDGGTRVLSRDLGMIIMIQL